MEPLPQTVPAADVAPEGPTLAGQVRRWAGILSAYFTAQTLTQLAGLTAGLLLVRFLPVRQFALYTLATSVVTFFTFASDLGSTGSLVFFFRRCGERGEDFQTYLRAVLSLRRTAFLLGTAAVLLVFPRSAHGQGFGGAEVAAVTALLLACVWFQIAASVRLLALRLAGRFGRSYAAELTGGLIRLALALLMVGAALLEAWLALLGAALATAAVAGLAGAGGKPAGGTAPARAVGNAVPATENRAVGPATRTGGADLDLARGRRQVLRYLLPSLPAALYFSFQGPLVIWLAATFGAARNIAEVGALGRLGLIVGLFSGLTGTVLLPRLAHVADDRLYRLRYLQYGALLLALALAMLGAALVFPGAFLFLLGPHYAGLHRELTLVVAGAGLTLLGGYAVGVNLARSWNRWEGLAVVALFTAQAAMVAWLPLATTAAVLEFNLVSGLVGLAAQLAITAIGFRRPRWVEWMR